MSRTIQDVTALVVALEMTLGDPEMGPPIEWSPETHDFMRDLSPVQMETFAAMCAVVDLVTKGSADARQVLLERLVVQRRRLAEVKAGLS